MCLCLAAVPLTEGSVDGAGDGFPQLSVQQVVVTLNQGAGGGRAEQSQVLTIIIITNYIIFLRSF